MISFQRSSFVNRMNCKVMVFRNHQTYLGLVVLTTVLSACGGSSNTGDIDGNIDSNVEAIDPIPVADPRGADGSYLFVTHNASNLGENEEQALYYGTRNVGTRESYSVRIANRGADTYTLNNIMVVGKNAEEFSTPVLNEITLLPAQAASVDVAFLPITEGPKEANFTVDYDTKELASEADSQTEQSYYEAADLAKSGKLVAARKKYTNYLADDPVTNNKQRAAMRLPIIDEGQNLDTQHELTLYLEAMSERDYNDYARALHILDVLLEKYPDSYIADDAQYLKGYIYLMDLDDPANALRAMQAVRKNYPDSTYYDTVLYSEAIAQNDLGNLLLAKELLLELKLRHTGVDTLGIQLPKDSLESRLWFDRATDLLNTV